jgi:hypothetical protein
MTTPNAVDATATSDLELQKLAFEREKQELEERWRKRTFIWTIASTLLGVVVTISVPLISGSKGDATNLSQDTVRDCRSSLQRLPTLANIQGATIDSLRSAIAKHVDVCDQVLVDMIAFLSKRGS